MNLTIFARDSILWKILFYVGFAFTVGVGFIDDPTKFHLTPATMYWLQLIAGVITAVSGKLGMSLVPLKRNMQLENKQ